MSNSHVIPYTEMVLTYALYRRKRKMRKCTVVFSCRCVQLFH